MTAALSLLGALCLTCVGVAGSGVWGDTASNGRCCWGEAVEGVGRATDIALAGRGVGWVEDQGMDNTVVDHGVWGVQGRVVHWAVLLGGRWLGIRQCPCRQRHLGRKWWCVGGVVGGGAAVRHTKQ